MEETVRDFEQEVKDLYEARPEIRGEELPEDVVDACIAGTPLKQAYEEYADARARRANAEAAKRAPVTAVTRGGAVTPSGEDAFLRGFNSGW